MPRRAAWVFVGGVAGALVVERALRRIERYFSMPLKNLLASCKHRPMTLFGIRGQDTVGSGTIDRSRSQIGYVIHGSRYAALFSKTIVGACERLGTRRNKKSPKIRSYANH